jgi:hypothetical protein
MVGALFKQLGFIVFAVLLSLAAPQSSHARCDADRALRTPPKLSVETSIADLLSDWVEQNARTPLLTSQNLSERVAARVWSISSQIPKIHDALRSDAQKILAKSSPPPQNLRPYDTVSLLAKFKDENQGVDIWSERAQKIIHFQTTYLKTEAERAPYKMTLKNGLVYDANGALFDTSDGDLRGLSNSQGKAMGVLSAEGELFAMKEQELGKLHHSTLLGGDPVAFAFEFVVKNGVITEIKNLSGHYLPPIELYAQFLDRLLIGKVNIDAIDLQSVKVTPPLISEITQSLISERFTAGKLTSAFHQAKRFMDFTDYSDSLKVLLSKATPTSRAIVENAVSAIDHVGFLVPAGTTIEMLEEAAKENGFTEGHRSFASVIVAKELGVPTQIFICKEKLPSGDFRAIEVFIPQGDEKIVGRWIEQGVGTHVAFRVKTNEGVEEIKNHLSEDGFEMPGFMNNHAMANPQQGSLTIYFDQQRGPQKLRMEFVHTASPR